MPKIKGDHVENNVSPNDSESRFTQGSESIVPAFEHLTASSILTETAELLAKRRRRLKNAFGCWTESQASV